MKQQIPIKVTNMDHTSDQDPPYPYTSWLEYWRCHKKERYSPMCSTFGCNSWATDGAHVTSERLGEQAYIVPLCHECNMRTDEFYVNHHDLLKI